MSLNSGTRLGPYEILAPLGAGGMGEVYRARDTRLGRDVAIKILPSHLSANPDLRQRFEREARAISSLSHPNICHLYDVGSQNGSDYLVMEYMEGETLADRLAKGRIRLGDALKIAAEIADALEKAHRHGIVHRDLKPGNIMLTPSGAKLMDFGLAKPLAAAATANSIAGPITPSSPTNLMASLAAPASPLTTAGTVVGTFQYLAPEVLQGAEADARSDIFSFGCVLYEMVTGRRAFEGKSQLSVMTAILEQEPAPIANDDPLAPPALDYTVRSCLTKNPEERLQTAHDVGLQLRWIARSSGSANASTAKKATISKRWPVALAAAAALLVVVFAILYVRAITAPKPVVRATINPPETVVFDFVGDTASPPAISPDATKLVFGAHLPNSPLMLWIRHMDSEVATRLDGTEEAMWPFWSPDGAYIGFFSRGTLNKVPVGGGPVTTIAAAPQPRGGTWGADDIILFAPDFQGPIMRVSANGGTATPVTKVDATIHTTHRWPWILPDGKHFLYYATSHTGGNSGRNGIYFGSLANSETRMVLASDAAAQFASGHLLFHSQNSIMAQSFDPRTGSLNGTAIMVADHVLDDAGTWRAVFAVSANGTMLYEPGGTSGANSVLVWFDRSGKQLAQLGPEDVYQDPRISPDGRKVAVSAGAILGEIWTIDVERGVRTRLTFNSGNNFSPAWSPDGKLIAYNSSSGMPGAVKAVIKARMANGSGAEQVLAEEPDSAGLTMPEWSSDGKYLAYLRSAGPAGHSIYAKPLSGDGKPFAVVTPPNPQANVTDFRISPDGHWVAYASNESGQLQVYVAPFPSGSGKWQVSTTSSDYPSWRADGKELYFSNNTDNYLYAAAVAASGTDFAVNSVKQLFKVTVTAGPGITHDVSPDGKRFLFNVSPRQANAALTLVLNWTELLKK